MISWQRCGDETVVAYFKVLSRIWLEGWGRLRYWPAGTTFEPWTFRIRSAISTANVGPSSSPLTQSDAPNRTTYGFGKAGPVKKAHTKWMGQLSGMCQVRSWTVRTLRSGFESCMRHGCTNYPATLYRKDSYFRGLFWSRTGEMAQSVKIQDGTG